MKVQNWNEIKLGFISQPRPQPEKTHVVFEVNPSDSDQKIRNSGIVLVRGKDNDLSEAGLDVSRVGSIN